jgi:hypothetical protein
MKPTLTHRYLFSKEEIIAALFDVKPTCDYPEIRIDGDEVVIEFVNPKHVEQQLTTPEDDTFPGDQPSKTDDEDERLSPLEYSQKVEQQQRKPAGENEREALDLCGQKIFQTFLEVKTEEAAQRVLLERCHAKSLSELDTVKSWRANFRDVVAEFDMWMRGD